MRYWRKIGMGLAAALLCAALPAAAQLPNNLAPAAATKVAELEAKEMTADLADKAAISEQILKVIGADTGEESREYLEKLMVHSTNLSFARRTPEAQRRAWWPHVRSEHRTYVARRPRRDGRSRR